MQTTITKIKDAQEFGVYSPTTVDFAKDTADFRIIDLGYIRWKDGKGESVTKKQLEKLQKIHTWATDF